MSLFTGPEAHEANPPESWVVVKSGSHWALTNKDGHVFETTETKHAAEALKVEGWLFNMWQQESHWYAGGTVANWKPYAVVKAEQEAAEARLKAWAAKVATA